MTAAATNTVVRVEHALWTPGSEWDAALEHIASRFARVSPLDLDSVRASGTFEAQHAALGAWAEQAGIDLDRELGRFLDEHLAMHVRPDPAVTRAIRARAVAGPVHAVTVLGERCGESILRHAGCWRSITRLHAGIAPGEVPAELEGANVVTTLDEVRG